MDCVVCTEKCTKRRQNIKCQYCDFSACVVCCKTYIMSLNKPKCMNNACVGEWSMKFMRDNFTQVFIKNEFRDHQKNVLVEQQLALMPESQLVIEERKRIERIDAKMNKLRKELRSTREHYKKIEDETIGEYNKKVLAIASMKNWHTNYYGGLYIEQVKRAIPAFEAQVIEDSGLAVILNSIVDFHAKVDDIIKKNEVSLEEFKTKIAPEWDNKHKIDRDRRIAELENLISGLITERGRPTTVKREFVRKCGDSECRGFLSTRWKCGVCEKSTCQECHEIKSDDHVCDANCVATIKLLKADTRDSPGCQASIFKIDGCDQMWCTQCKTGFSWNTGKIEMKLHNPHYYEWRRQNGGLDREPGDMQCGDVLGADMVTQIISEFRRHPLADEKSIESIIESIRRCVHISAYNNVPTIPNYEEQRIHYLNKVIDIEELKTLLVRSDKAYAKKQELYTVYSLLVVTFTDIMRRFRSNLATSDPNVVDYTILNEAKTIIDYVNGCFADIGYTYGCISKHVIGYDMSVSKVSLRGHREPTVA